MITDNLDLYYLELNRRFSPYTVSVSKVHLTSESTRVYLEETDFCAIVVNADVLPIKPVFIFLFILSMVSLW